MLRAVKGAASRGKNLKFLRCNRSYCEDKNYKMGDDIICFVNCFHTFHKFCFEKLNEEKIIPKEGMLVNIKSVCKICSKTETE